MIGQILKGRYHVLEVLGEGNFSQTYIAEDVDLPGNPKCVVKQLKPKSTDVSTLEIARRMFQGEAEALSQLPNHDQVPRLLAFSKEEFYLVQDYVEGHPLTDELYGLQRDESYVIQLLIEGLQVLKFVHSHKMIHRDIKPENLIRRNRDGKLVLIDFGAVKQKVIAEAQGNPTVVIGTCGYLPPEQRSGNPQFNSDLYALGMVGIQAITGNQPETLQVSTKTGEIEWQSVKVTPKLAEVLSKMVRLNHLERYQTAAAALDAVRALQHKSAKSGKQIALLGGFVIVVSLILGIFGGYLSRHTSQPTQTRDSVVQTPSIDPMYLKLKQALAQGDLKAADDETYELMIELAGPISKRQGLFDQEEWNKFDCDRLREIDRLWGDSTNNQQGFTVQKRIFDETLRDSNTFQKRVGWKSETGPMLVKRSLDNVTKKVFYVKEPKFKNPPQGHLPTKFLWENLQDLRLNRLDTCKF